MTRRSSVEDDTGELHRFDVSATWNSSVVPENLEERDTNFMTSAKPIASSIPGMAKARSCIMPPIPPSPSPAEIHHVVRRGRGDERKRRESAPPSTRSFMEAVGSISMALRLVKPFTLVASLPNF